MPDGLDRAGHAVGPRRQGRRAGRRDASGETLRRERSRRTCGRGATPGRKLLVPYVTGGLGARLARRRARRRRRRRRRGRDRHPVLRPGDGRPHDPGGVASGRSTSARRRSAIIDDAARRSTSASRSSVMTYYNLVAPHGPRALRARARATPASTARSCPTCRSTSSTAGATRPTPPASRRCCSPRRPRPTSGCARSASGRTGSSTACR